MNDLVECRSEANYAGRPTALHWLGQRLAVAEVIVSWREPEGIHFRVCTDDDQAFELSYDEAGDTWHIEEL
jgi:hypothetical protein